MNDWPKIKEWRYKNADCWIVEVPVKVRTNSPRLQAESPDLFGPEETRGRYNGYCRFVERPVRESGYSGVLTYVPVHGGITYANTDEDGITYGFDCAHAGDPDKHPHVNDLAWMAAEVERMVDGIRAAADFENQYVNALDGEDRAGVLTAYHWHLKNDYGIDFDLTNNFGAMIGSLGGLEQP